MDEDDDEAKRLSMIEARLRERARMKPNAKIWQKILILIYFRRFILEERAKKTPIKEIVSALEDEGIFISEGTVRNYIPQIEKAIDALEAIGVTDPSEAEIHRMVILQVKENRNSSRHRTRGRSMNPSNGIAAAHLPNPVCTWPPISRSEE